MQWLLPALHLHLQVCLCTGGCSQLQAVPGEPGSEQTLSATDQRQQCKQNVLVAAFPQVKTAHKGKGKVKGVGWDRHCFEYHLSLAVRCIFPRTSSPVTHRTPGPDTRGGSKPKQRTAQRAGAAAHTVLEEGWMRYNFGHQLLSCFWLFLVTV